MFFVLFSFFAYIKPILQHDYLSPTHSRTSSSASSTGISFTNSTNSNKTTPTQSNKSSPVHSREGSLTTSPSSRNGHIKQSSFEHDKNEFNHNNLVNKYNGINNNKTMTLPRYQIKLIESKINVDENDNCFEKSNGNQLIEDSVYGSILNTSKKKGENGFEYKTFDGSVIKSVLPPGKGLTLNYKVGAFFVLFFFFYLCFSSLKF